MRHPYIYILCVFFFICCKKNNSYVLPTDVYLSTGQEWASYGETVSDSVLNAILLLKDERLYMEQYADSIMSKNEKNIVLLSEQQALRLLFPCIPIDSKRKFFVNLKGVKPINGNLWMAVYGVTTQSATKNPECKHYLVVYDNACAPCDVMAFDIGKERQVVASSREKERIVTSTRYCVFTDNMHFQRVSAYTQRMHNRTTGKDSILEKRNKWYSYEVDKRGHFLLLDSIIILK